MPRIKENSCPCCGYVSDAATSMADEKLVPKSGDLSICFNCGDFLQYGDGLVLNKMPESVLDDIDQDSLDEMLLIRKAIMRKNNGT